MGLRMATFENLLSWPVHPPAFCCFQEEQTISGTSETFLPYLPLTSPQLLLYQSRGKQSIMLNVPILFLR